MNILVIDVGGSYIKCLATGHKNSRKFESRPNMTPGQMVKRVLRIVKRWRFDAVSIGYPGVVRNDAPGHDLHNLGLGWVGFDFRTAFSLAVTSNPTIFEQAIRNTEAYDDAIHRKVKEGKSGEALFFELALEDLTQAAALLRPAYDASGGVDGWVSLKVSPALADDAAGTIEEAKRLHARAQCPNGGFNVQVQHYSMK